MHLGRFEIQVRPQLPLLLTWLHGVWVVMRAQVLGEKICTSAPLPLCPFMSAQPAAEAALHHHPHSHNCISPSNRPQLHTTPSSTSSSCRREMGGTTATST